MPAVFRRISPSMIVACAALAVALGGTSYAAVVLPASSVGTAQLKANAVTGAKVKDGSLTAADFASGAFPSPPAIVVRTHAETETGPGIENIAVSCAPGEQAVGGGVSLSTGGGGTILASYPVQVGAVFRPRVEGRPDAERLVHVVHEPDRPLHVPPLRRLPELLSFAGHAVRAESGT